MSKLIKLKHSNPWDFDYSFYCFGCEQYHNFRTTGTRQPVWTFNGNMEKPTVRASIKVTWCKYPPEVEDGSGDFAKNEDGTYKTENGRLIGCKDIVCHLFITDGQIKYLHDCTHKFVGKTVDMQNET